MSVRYLLMMPIGIGPLLLLAVTLGIYLLHH